jgi:predicted CXXCH cytochrome family protein
MTMKAITVALVLLLSSCTDDPEVATTEQDISWGDLPAPGPTTIHTPIGLALDIEDGVGVPLQARARQTFYINQIDMRAHLETTVDEGVNALAHGGDFDGLDWRGISDVDQSFVYLPNTDGTFTRRRFFRDARWMNDLSLFLIEQLDANGHLRSVPIVVDTGLLDLRTNVDSFFARRLRAIQWTNNCVSKTDCSSANNFEEEALVELRYANGPKPGFQLDPATTQLRVTWTANRGHVYTIPVQQVAQPEWDYGFGIDLHVLTPPAADGTYHAGQQLDVQFTLKDGSGKPLHPPGQLPTLQDYVTGNDPAGIDYWTQAERVATYYRRKHKEKQMVVAIDGPVQDAGTIYNTLDFIGDILGTTDGSVVTATPAVNGFFGEASSVPSWQTMIGVNPPDAPVSDHVHFTLPADAQSGTYKIVMKARRSYMGEELPRAQVLAIQVGTTQQTHKTFDTGNCTTCHSSGSDLTRISHGLRVDQRDVCTTCHTPLPFEPEGPIYVRTHFVHSRSGRLDASPGQCNLCHTDRAGIQRTSKSACMSCHKTYPDDHVTKYGPIVDMYIGGTLDDSFQQCTSTCHRNHPNSRL